MNYRGGVCRRPQMTPDNTVRHSEVNMLHGSSCGVYGVAGTNTVPYKKECDSVSLATVYSPVQEWREIYSGDIALVNGTIFAELDKPFKGWKDNRGCYR